MTIRDCGSNSIETQRCHVRFSGTTYYSPDYTPKDETWYGYYDEYGYYNEIDADDGNGIADFFSSLFGEEAPVTEPPEEAEAPDAV